MRKIYTILFGLSSLFGYAQIKFQPGYIVTNNGEKKEVLIKNNDWKYAPTSIEIKYAADQKPESLSIKEIKEFEILNESKYIRATVDIDQSSFDLNNLSVDKKPFYKKTEVFLKQLVQGNVNLYEYQNSNPNYFIQKEQEDLIPLVYKMYYVGDGNKYTYNNGYRFQLSRYLNCDNADKLKYNTLKYDNKELSKAVMDYNKCENADLVYEDNKIAKKIDFNLSIRPRYNFSSYSAEGAYTNYSFKNKNSLAIGLEAEFILPFNKNKWAIIAEPTYQYFKSESTKGETKINYNSIELPFGVRHYMFLNDNNKLFVNAQYLIDFDLGSTIDFYKDNIKQDRELDIKSNNTFALGIGYNYKSKYSIEARYIPTRNLLSNYNYWSSNYQTFSIILGYNFF